MNLRLIQKDKEELLMPHLPEVSIIDQIVKPKIESMYPALIKALKAEIEIYRNIPKEGITEEDMPKKSKHEKEWDEKRFDPRHPTSCFMGKAFKQKAGMTTSALELYRERIGTIQHKIWGDATLLEIWGGDHFKDYPKMVSSVFRYAYGLRDTLPRGIKFYVNPLTTNEFTGKMNKTKAEKEHQEYLEDLYARAQVFGVKTPEQARRSRRR